MQNDWILDVLADVRRFASMNGLPKLARHLEETVDLAAAEIAMTAGGPSRAVSLEVSQAHGHGDLGKGA